MTNDPNAPDSGIEAGASAGQTEAAERNAPSNPGSEQAAGGQQDTSQPGTRTLDGEVKDDPSSAPESGSP